MKTKMAEFENRWETLKSMTEAQQEAERAVKHAREQRATAIVTKILKVLEDEELTVEDAHRIGKVDYICA